MYCKKCNSYIPETPDVVECPVCEAPVNAPPVSTSSVSESQQELRTSPTLLTRLRWAAGLMIASMLTCLLCFLPGNVFHSLRYTMLISMIWGLYLVYEFLRRKNWARIWLLVCFVSNLIFIPLGLSAVAKDLPMLIVYGFDMALSVYLLIFLRKPEVKAYFSAAAHTKKSRRKGWLIALGIVTAFIVLFVVFVFGISFFYMKKASRMDICVEDLRSTEIIRLTRDGRNAFPRFSHDGSRIAFSSVTKGDDHSASLDLFSSDGVDRKTLVKDGRFNVSPMWSLDDSAIFYLTTDKGKSDVHVYEFSTNSSRPLTTDGNAKQDLSISGDGRWLLYIQSVKGDEKQIFVMPSSGGDPIQLTHENDFFKTPQFAAWLKNEPVIMYQSFTDIVFIDIEGQKVNQISLVPYGLGNIAGLMADPVDEDKILIKARPANDIKSGFGFNLYKLSMETADIEEFKKSSILEIGYDFSPDGQKIIYSAAPQEN